MANRAIYKPDIPYPDKIYEVGERVARRAMDEFIRKQSILFRKEEEEKRKKKELETRKQDNACDLAGIPAFSEAHK